VTDRAVLRLHDTYAGAVRDFVPLRDGHVSIYLCGATVQGLPHIGHVRSAVAFDVLRRWLMARGYDVAFIRNVTDIDDKILNKAADAGRPWWEWAATHERAFTAAYASCPVTRSKTSTRAKASARVSATNATSRCGRARNPASRRGRPRGDVGAPAGIPNAWPWHTSTSARNSISTAVEWI
jgi:hypothetical protein